MSKSTKLIKLARTQLASLASTLERLELELELDDGPPLIVSDRDELQRAMHLVCVDLGPGFALELDCGPMARIVQRDGGSVVWRGAWVGADIDPEALRRATRETLEAGPPYVIAAHAGLLLPVVQAAIDRARHRLPRLAHAYDAPGRRPSRLARLLVREHRELSAGRRSGWSARARHGWQRWLGKHAGTDPGTGTLDALVAAGAWICLTSQGHTQWSRALCEARP